MRAFPVMPGSPIPSVPTPGIVAPAVTLLVIRSGSKNRSYIQSSTELMGKVTDAKEIKKPIPRGKQSRLPTTSRPQDFLQRGTHIVFRAVLPEASTGAGTSLVPSKGCCIYMMFCPQHLSQAISSYPVIQFQEAGNPVSFSPNHHC